ncbi:hypothetical protein CCH79_00013145, partial [Gambusia affinis]
MKTRRERSHDSPHADMTELLLIVWERSRHIHRLTKADWEGGKEREEKETGRKLGEQGGSGEVPGGATDAFHDILILTEYKVGSSPAVRPMLGIYPEPLHGSKFKPQSASLRAEEEEEEEFRFEGTATRGSESSMSGLVPELLLKCINMGTKKLSHSLTQQLKNLSFGAFLPGLRKRRRLLVIGVTGRFLCLKEVKTKRALKEPSGSYLSGSPGAGLGLGVGFRGSGSRLEVLLGAALSRAGVAWCLLLLLLLLLLLVVVVMMMMVTVGMMRRRMVRKRRMVGMPFKSCIRRLLKKSCDKYAATGRSFNVPLGYKLKSTDSLKWKFNEKVIFDKKRSHMLTGKATDITEDGSLKLTNLKKDQEGLYTAEVFNNNGIAQKTVKKHLCIQDPVKKPAVEAECKEEENKVIFKCDTDKTPKSEIKKYQWLRNNVQMDKMVPTFKLTAAETKDIKFACNISNEVSFEISEPVTHNCTKIGFPENRCGIRLWVFNGYNVVYCSGRKLCCSSGIQTKYKLKPPDTLKWTLNGSIIFYKNRLTNLQKDQAGLYTGEVLDESVVGQIVNIKFSENFKTHAEYQHISLMFSDPVKKPEVKATCQDANVTFRCVSGA